jgi:small subunit ribosomal protein S1
MTSDDKKSSFAALFEAQPQKPGKPQRNLRVGDTIEAIVVRVGKETIFLEIDGKRQAMLDAVEMRGADGTIDVKEGDTLRAKVVEVDETSGSVRLGRSFGKPGDATQIQQAFDAGIPVEGKVAGVNKGGIEVDLGRGLRGFCPMSQIAATRVDDPKELIGETFSFLVTEIKDGGRSIVLSRRRVLESEAQRARDDVLRSLEKGQIVSGTVSAVRDFGAFVDLGGIDGLIPKSEMGARSLAPGEAVQAQVLEIKADDKGQTRITLSLKALLPAPERPTKTVGTSKLAIGAIVRGKVVRIETYGVFVQVEGESGREGRGLIPAAELGVARGVDLRKTFPEGTELTAKVLETGEGRLKLSVKAAKEDAERSEFESHKDQATAGSFGTFADLMKKKR